MDTKEKILQTALHLFAEHGFAGVSMRDIAVQIGITKAALYRHYDGKRAIFNAIVERMAEIDGERAAAYDVPLCTCEEDPVPYQNADFQALCAYTTGQFEYWTANPFAVDFRRMITLEQYCDEEMALLYRNHLGEGPVAYTADIFREMMNLTSEEEAYLLALEFFAPVAMLIQISDHAAEKETVGKVLKAHLDGFEKKYF